jgi:hypothetical protein
MEDIQTSEAELRPALALMHLSGHSQETGRWPLPLPKMAIRQRLAVSLPMPDHGGQHGPRPASMPTSKIAERTAQLNFTPKHLTDALMSFHGQVCGWYRREINCQSDDAAQCTRLRPSSRPTGWGPGKTERITRRAIPKISFTRPQMVAILHAAANYHRILNGHSADLEGKADRLHVFVTASCVALGCQSWTPLC